MEGRCITLVLSRKPGEHIHIGDGLITITVVRIGPNTVRLGITCPKDINIVRSELCEASVVDGAIVIEQTSGETPDQREHRKAIEEQKKKPRGRIRGSK